MENEYETSLVLTREKNKEYRRGCEFVAKVINRSSENKEKK